MSAGNQLRQCSIALSRAVIARPGTRSTRAATPSGRFELIPASSSQSHTRRMKSSVATSRGLTSFFPELTRANGRSGLSGVEGESRVDGGARRGFASSSVMLHGGKGRPKPGEGVKLKIVESNGTEHDVEANVGDDIVDVSWEYDLGIEAACEKSVACSTCHVILDPEVYDKLEEPSDEENDMLDLAFGLTDTSRLGCQVKIIKEMDGSTIRLPSATRNMFVDGHKPQPH